ncbi:uncharacterized protein MELLADRAFT_58970 [Melampsora larici-populina 98AG31]|uniref:Uncharacterized protein n=1 Tax=Melampsora larici-populina (strain 98AG31 / pathotype 3-4-7) TaxID=747676 RepID=F4R6L0_MELLP|nr:uncharacterized protein MELLADRAFT_58970 [Melampsora larici-populina 98AG31]EGG12445.1 hypothetical protein MELLADRAFT_58970 [Melampsora larici-populina 98AG31]
MLHFDSKEDANVHNELAEQGELQESCRRLREEYTQTKRYLHDLKEKVPMVHVIISFQKQLGIDRSNSTSLDEPIQQLGRILSEIRRVEASMIDIEAGKNAHILVDKPHQ